MKIKLDVSGTCITVDAEIDRIYYKQLRIQQTKTQVPETKI